MSDASNDALQLLKIDELGRALDAAIDSVDQAPNDWHCHYAVGICLRQMKHYAKSCDALETANYLDPTQTAALLALAISRQLNQQYVESLAALRKAIEIDPEYYIAFNTLGMTQKLMGDYEKASLNYHAGANVLARVVAKKLVNKRSNQIHRHQGTTYDLWASYAMNGALYLAARDNIDRIVMPTGESAELESRTKEHDGLLWVDSVDSESKSVRLFFPNYFNTMFDEFRRNRAFANFMGNRSTVLDALGQVQDAEKHRTEAEEFSA